MTRVSLPEGRLNAPSIRQRQCCLKRPTRNCGNASTWRFGPGSGDTRDFSYGQDRESAVERQLAHVESNDVRRAYLRGEHWKERVQVMQFWSDYLDQLRAAEKIVRVRFGRSHRFASPAWSSD